MGNDRRRRAVARRLHRSRGPWDSVPPLPRARTRLAPVQPRAAQWPVCFSVSFRAENESMPRKSRRQTKTPLHIRTHRASSSCRTRPRTTNRRHMPRCIRKNKTNQKKDTLEQPAATPPNPKKRIEVDFVLVDWIESGFDFHLAVHDDAANCHVEGPVLTNVFPEERLCSGTPHCRACSSLHPQHRV